MHLFNGNMSAPVMQVPYRSFPFTSIDMSLVVPSRLPY